MPDASVQRTIVWSKLNLADLRRTITQAAIRDTKAGTVYPKPLATLPKLSGIDAAYPDYAEFFGTDGAYAIYSLGGAIKLLYGDVPVDLPTPNSSEVIAIVPESTRLMIVREDGTIEVLDRATRQITMLTELGEPFWKVCSSPKRYQVPSRSSRSSAGTNW